MSTMRIMELFKDGEPVYQPAGSHGYQYHEPYSASDSTYWFRSNDPDDAPVPREEVAKAIGVEVNDLLRWEHATDLEAEHDGRSDFGDW